MEKHFGILLIEDNETDVDLIKEALEDAFVNCDLYIASDGEEACRLLPSIIPDMVLLDLNLPKRNGIEVLRFIKTDDRLKSVPTIILTNSCAHNDVLNAYRNHCNAYIRKPMGFDELVNIMRIIRRFWFEVAIITK